MRSVDFKRECGRCTPEEVRKSWEGQGDTTTWDWMQREQRKSFHSAKLNSVWKEGDWDGSSLAGDRHRRTKDLSNQKYICLVLVGCSNKDENFDVPSSLPLKLFFNDYAEKRDVSLRSLRFSYNGKTLFLSSAGNQSPNELNMQDKDMITVYDTRSSNSQEASGALPLTHKKNHKKTGAVTNAPKRHKYKSKKKRIHREEPVVTLADCKHRHSMRLSKVHEEVQPRLKGIRTRLNRLDLELQPPKQRKMTKRKKTVKGADLRVLPNFTVGRKAGRPYFLVRVGEENNLYSTTKLPPQHGRCDIPVLDLHGFTREEALVKLEDNRKVWVDTAIRGSYPFVIPAMIVCGGGNQILSETVQKWIKSTKNICSSPKSYVPRGAFRHVE